MKKRILIKFLLLTMTVTFALSSFNTHTYAWHENLGIDANKAAELYKTSPNDPAIIQWKNALQSAINDMGNCYNIESAISCESLFSTIISNCNSHPNELLACNDSRLAQFPLILTKAEEAQKKAEEAEKAQAEKHAIDIIDACILDRLNAGSNFELASPLCESDLRSLLQDCNMTSPQYNYCKDERFVGYLTQHNVLNSTVSP